MHCNGYNANHVQSRFPDKPIITRFNSRRYYDYTAYRIGVYELIFTLAIFVFVQAPEAVSIGSIIQDCPQCPPMVVVPGLNNSRKNLIIARHELTWREYIPSVLELSCPLPEPEEKRVFPKDVTLLSDDFPIVGLPPSKIGCYLDWLKRKTGRSYRLPTGQEWEHAARAGATTTFPWGNEIGHDNAAIATRYSEKREPRFHDPRQWVSPVNMLAIEQFKPNAWGLYDVVGNVAEYTAGSRSGDAVCVARLDATRCRRTEIRGGGKGIVSVRIGEGEVAQADPIGIPVYSFNVSQPIGYRLVRD